MAILSNNQVVKHIPISISRTVTFLHMFMVIMHSVRQLLKLNHRVGLSVDVYALCIVTHSIALHPVITDLVTALIRGEK